MEVLYLPSTFVVLIASLRRFCCCTHWQSGSSATTRSHSRAKCTSNYSRHNAALEHERTNWGRQRGRRKGDRQNGCGEITGKARTASHLVVWGNLRNVEFVTNLFLQGMLKDLVDTIVGSLSPQLRKGGSHKRSTNGNAGEGSDGSVPRLPTIDPSALRQLQDMGFAENRAKKALLLHK